MRRAFRHLKDIQPLLGVNSPALFEYSVNISLRFGFLYVEVPKVACSTIKATLQKAECGVAEYEFSDLEDVHMRQYSPLLSPRRVIEFAQRLNSGEWFQFAFVREPFERLLSVYLDKIRGVTNQKRSLAGVIPELNKRPGMEISFAEFVEAVCAQNFAEMDNHWRLQSELLCHRSIRYDFIGHLENFDADFRQVLDRIGIDPSYYQPFAPHATGSLQKMAEYYTDELVELVAEKYRPDFEMYGYVDRLA